MNFTALRDSCERVKITRKWIQAVSAGNNGERFVCWQRKAHGNFFSDLGLCVRQVDTEDRCPFCPLDISLSRLGNSRGAVGRRSAAILQYHSLLRGHCQDLSEPIGAAHEHTWNQTTRCELQRRSPIDEGGRRPPLGVSTIRRKELMPKSTTVGSDDNRPCV